MVSLKPRFIPKNGLIICPFEYTLKILIYYSCLKLEILGIRGRRITVFFIPTKVNIGSLKINSPDHIGSVSFGSNLLVGINVAGKKNQGFGQQFADCSLSAIPIQIILDNEIIDSTSMKSKI
jgi:hypothetical protein